MNKLWVVGIVAILLAAAGGLAAVLTACQPAAPATPVLDVVVAAHIEVTGPPPEPVEVEPTVQASSQPAEVRGELSGVVQDADGPLEGAVVRIVLTELETVSAADGSFSLGEVTLTQPVSVTAWLPDYQVGGATAWLDLEPVTITSSSTIAPTTSTMTGSRSTASRARRVARPATSPTRSGRPTPTPSRPPTRALSVSTGHRRPRQQGKSRYDASGRLMPPDSGEPYYGPGVKLDYPDRAQQLRRLPHAAGLQAGAKQYLRLVGLPHRADGPDLGRGP